MDDVAGEAAEAERELAGEVEEGAGGDEDGAEDEEGAAEGAGGVHRRSLAQGGGSGCASVERSRFLASLGMTGFCVAQDVVKGGPKPAPTKASHDGQRTQACARRDATDETR